MLRCWVVLFFLTANCFALELSKVEKSPKSLNIVKRIVGKYKRKDLIDEIRDFVACCRPSRMVGSPGHTKAVPFLVKTIKKSDPNGTGVLSVDEFLPDTDHAIDIYKNDFKKLIKDKYPPTHPMYIRWDGATKDMIATFERLRGFKGKNVIWEKRGKTNPEEVLIIGAHFDTVGHNADTLRINPKISQPGADDNGTGVALALGLIEVLAQMDLKRTVRVVFFDYEEVGFLGSLAYVRKYKKAFKKEKLAGYINLEMLGNDTKKYDKTKKHGNMKAYIRRPNDAGHTADRALADMFMGLGKKINKRVKFELSPNGFNSSDHIHFWQAGFAAITFSQDWENDFNNRYHTENDFVETLNMKTFYNSFQYIAGAVIAWSFQIYK